MLCRRSNGFVLIGGLGATRADGGTPSAFAPPERREFQIFLGKKFETHNAGASPFARWLSIGGFARAFVLPVRSSLRTALIDVGKSKAFRSRGAYAREAAISRTPSGNG